MGSWRKGVLFKEKGGVYGGEEWRGSAGTFADQYNQRAKALQVYLESG